MSESTGHPILGPLGNQLFRRLEFRYGPFKDTVRGLQNRAAQEGLARSGGFVRRLVNVFRTEAQDRSEVIEQVLRSFRLSCSPSDIISLHEGLCTLLQITMKQTLVYAGNDCRAALGPIGLIFTQDIHKIFEDELLKCEGNCLGLMQGLVDEVVMAAKTYITAAQERDRPTYTISNQFAGPVASVSQGTSSVGSVSQTNASASPTEIADAILVLLIAIKAHEALNPETMHVVAELSETQTELRTGRSQIGRISRALDVLSRIQDIALRAPDIVGKTHDLLQMLGLVP